MEHQKESPGENGLKLSLIQQQLSLICLSPPADDTVVRIGFASDQLSHVLAQAPQKSILVTTQTHINVIAVASFTGISSVIVTSGYRPATEVLSQALEQGIGIYATPADTFAVIAELARLGLKGRQEVSAPLNTAATAESENEKIHG